MNKGNIVRVMVTFEARLVKTPDGNIYGTGPINYDFSRRYLKVFDEVVVLARVREVAKVQLDKVRPAEGENLRVFCLPCYLGPWQYLKQYHKLNALAEKAIQQADAFILRVPGAVGNMLWGQLIKKKIPYGVEVVADPWDVFAPGSIKTVLRPFIRRIMSRKLAKQCHFASAASYVTEKTLQKRYPPGGWSTYYSTVHLPDRAIIDDDELPERFASLNDVVKGQRPFRICHAGSMSTLYKAQDILLEAVSICCNNGHRIELTLLGSGRYYGYYVEKAKVLGIYQNVKFLGHLPIGEPVREQLDAADLFVLPSLAEGQGRVLIEAMARANPCIGSDIGGIPELLDAEDLVAPGDAQALAQKIEEVISDRSRLERMARRNLKNAREYHIDKLSRRRKGFFEKLVEISRSRHCEMDV